MRYFPDEPARGMWARYVLPLLSQSMKGGHRLGLVQHMAILPSSGLFGVGLGVVGLDRPMK
jgi:hypothetical protein